MGTLNDLFTGTPPTYGVQVVGGGRSPFYKPAQAFGQYLMSLLGQQLPSYGGKIDPGLSPTLSALGPMLQAYAQSPLPGVLGQAGGALGRFMNPSFANPMARVQMGFPQYFGQNQGDPFQIGGSPPPFPMPPGGGGGMTNPFQPPPTSMPSPPFMGPPSGPSVSPVGPTGPPPFGGGDMSPQPMPPMGYGDDMAPRMIPPGLMPPSGPVAPPRKPGQMTREEWIAAGLTPAPRNGGTIKNAAMPLTYGPHGRNKKGKPTIKARTSELRGGLDMGDGINRPNKPTAYWADRHGGKLYGNPG